MPCLFAYLIFIILAALEVTGDILGWFFEEGALWLGAASLVILFAIGFHGALTEPRIESAREIPKRVGLGIICGIAMAIVYPIAFGVMAFLAIGGIWLLFKLGDWLKALIF